MSTTFSRPLFICLILLIAVLTSNFLLPQDSLKVVKPEFMVNSYAPGEHGGHIYYLDHATNAFGTTAMVWADKRNSVYEYYVQFFDKELNKLTDNMLLFDYLSSNSSFAGNCSVQITCNNNGEFLVAAAVEHDIIGQCYTNNGDKIGAPQLIVENYSDLRTSCISMDNNRNIAFVYDREVSGYTTTYVSLSTPYAHMKGNLFSVALSSRPYTKMGGIEYDSRVTLNKNNRFVAVWSGKYGGDSTRVYIQEFDEFGDHIGENRLISDSVFPGNNLSAAIASNGSNYCVVWSARSAGQAKASVYGRIITASGQFISSSVKMLEFDLFNGKIRLRKDNSGGFLIIKSEGNNYYFKTISADAKTLGAETALFGNEPASSKRKSLEITFSDNTGYLVSYLNEEKDFDEPFLQKLRNDGNTAGPQISPVFTVGSGNQANPTIKFNKQGGSIVVWEDYRTGPLQWYYQLYDAQHNPIGENTRLDTGDDFISVYSDRIGVLSDGSFVVPYINIHSGGDQNPELLVRKINKDGVSGRKLVTTAFWNSNNALGLSVNKNDEVIITAGMGFITSEYSSDYIVRYKLDKEMNRIGQEERLTQPVSGRHLLGLLLDSDEDGNTLATWRGNELLLSLVFGPDGNLKSDTIKVKSSNEVALMQNSICSGNEIMLYYFDFVPYKYKVHRIYLRDRKYEMDIDVHLFGEGSAIFRNAKTLLFCMNSYNIEILLLNDNKRTQENYFVKNYFDAPYMHYNGKVRGDVFGDKLQIVYTANSHKGTGFDIFSQVFRLEGRGFDHEAFLAPSDDDKLFNNYPNPFNPVTRIPFQVYSPHRVKLAVYDMLGREVKVLVDKEMDRGLYEVSFDATGLSSGIYICRMEAFNTKTIKMIHVK